MKKYGNKVYLNEEKKIREIRESNPIAVAFSCDLFCFSLPNKLDSPFLGHRHEKTFPHA